MFRIKWKEGREVIGVKTSLPAGGRLYLQIADTQQH
jgi:hypothetical protein